MRLRLKTGQRGDAPQADALLEGFELGKVGHVVADAAYDSDAIRRRVERMKAQACIKPNDRRTPKKRYDIVRYKCQKPDRAVLRTDQGVPQRAASRYDKKAASYLGFG